METLQRPEIRSPRIRRRDLAGFALLTGGYILMVLGIYEIGGLFNLTLGFSIVWPATLLILSGERRRLINTDDELRRMLDDPRAT